MKITVNIEADSAEELQEVFKKLSSGSIQDATVSTEPSQVGESAPAAEPAKPTRSRRSAEKPAEVPVIPITQSTDPLAGNSPAPAPAADPLGATQAPAADPLAGSAAPAAVAPVADPLAGSATPQSSEISLQMIREKIGKLTDNKQAVKDLVATYKKADGSACEKPSDLQEKDYANVYTDLDYI